LLIVRCFPLLLLVFARSGSDLGTQAIEASIRDGSLLILQFWDVYKIAVLLRLHVSRQNSSDTI
jgi:hypothetical protein